MSKRAYALRIGRGGDESQPRGGEFEGRVWDSTLVTSLMFKPTPVEPDRLSTFFKASMDSAAFVFHKAGSMREYAEDQLVFAAAQQEAPTDGLTPEEFRARLVDARLSHPLTDHVYSLRAARIKYVPFQFRPLLRPAGAATAPTRLAWTTPGPRSTGGRSCTTSSSPARCT